jgi:DNA-directed RNA polymerase specialized sigma24 family protein
VLRYYENLSSKQIGETLGMANTAVDMRLMRARRQLREYLAAPVDEN